MEPKVVTKGSFVAVVADTEWKAIQAASNARGRSGRAIRRCRTSATSYDAPRHAPRNSFTPTDNTTVRGNVDAAFASAAKKLSARYDFPQSIHGLIGPSVALASYDKSAGTMLIWAGSHR